MAKFTFHGLEEYEKKLSRLSLRSAGICKGAVYVMANIVTNEIRKGIHALKSVENQTSIIAYKRNSPVRISEAQKEGLLDGLGVSPMDNDKGYWNVKVGFAGYNAVKTRSYPNGQPNAMIARSVESGSSVLKKTPFVRPSFEASKGRAVEHGKAFIDAEIEKITKQEG